jgi:hypothetical protein
VTPQCHLATLLAARNMSHVSLLVASAGETPAEAEVKRAEKKAGSGVVGMGTGNCIPPSRNSEPLVQLQSTHCPAADGKEGRWELAVLRTLDWDSVQVDVVVDDRMDPAVHELLAGLGYMRLSQFLEVDLHIHPTVAPQLNVSSALTVSFHGHTDGSQGLGRAQGWDLSGLPVDMGSPHGSFRRAYNGGLFSKMAT